MAPSKPSTPPAPGFFASIPASIGSPSFYAGIPKQSFGKAMAYLCGFTFITMLLWIAIILVPPVVMNWGETKTAVIDFLNVYPDELVITIQDGEASTNVEEPYFLPLSEVIPVEEVDFDKMNLVVIDTKTAFSMKQFEEYQAVIWLSKDSVHIMDENEKVQTFSLSEVPDTVLDKEMADKLAGEVVDKILVILPFFALIVFVFVFVFLVISRMVYLLFFSFILWIATRIMNLPYDYPEAYKTGMYAVTLPSLVSLLVAWTGQWTGFYGFFFMFTLIGLLVAIVNLEKARR